MVISYTIGDLVIPRSWMLGDNYYFAWDGEYSLKYIYKVVRFTDRGKVVVSPLNYTGAYIPEYNKAAYMYVKYESSNNLGWIQPLLKHTTRNARF